MALGSGCSSRDAGVVKREPILHWYPYACGKACLGITGEPLDSYLRRISSAHACVASCASDVEPTQDVSVSVNSTTFVPSAFVCNVLVLHLVPQSVKINF